MTINTPDDADALMDTLTATTTDVCAIIKELLDIMGEDPVTFKDQIVRACGLRANFGCPSHPLCGGSS